MAAKKATKKAAKKAAKKAPTRAAKAAPRVVEAKPAKKRKSATKAPKRPDYSVGARREQAERDAQADASKFISFTSAELEKRLKKANNLQRPGLLVALKRSKALEEREAKAEIEWARKKAIAAKNKARKQREGKHLAKRAKRRALKKRPAVVRSVVVHPAILRRELAKSVKETRKALRARRVEVRAQCRAAKQSARERLREKIGKIRLKLKEMRAREIARIQAGCAQEREHIRASYHDTGEQLRAMRKHRAEERARIAAARKPKTGAALAAAQRALERRQETLGEARYEVERLHPEMLPAFDRMKNKIKTKGARMSVAESFFHWAMENPDEVIAVSEKKADQQFKKQLRTQQKTEKRIGRVYEALCRRATNDYKRGMPFRLTRRERFALEDHGISPDGLMTTCYAKPWSQRAAPF